MKLESTGVIKTPSAVDADVQASQQKHHTLPFALILLSFGYLLLASTSGFDWIDSWHDEQRAAQAIVLLVICMAFAVAVFTGRVGRIQLSVLLLSAFAIGAISAGRSDHLQAALAELGLWLSLLVFAQFAAATVRTNQQRCVKWLPRMVLLLSAAHVIGVLSRYVAAIELRGPMDQLVLLLGYANPRFPSALYALLMPFLAMLVTTGSERRDLRAISSVVLAFLWCLNMALETRAVFFSYLLGAPAIVLLLGWRNARSFVFVMAATALAGLLLYLVLFIGVPRWIVDGIALSGRSDSLLSPNGRQLLLISSWESIKSAPLLGIGPMAFAAIPHVWAAHPHNWVLQIAAEWGLPAAVLVVTAVIKFVLTKGRVVRNQALDSAVALPISMAAFASVAVGLIYGLVDGNLLMPVSQTAFFLFLGILMGSAPSRNVIDERALSRTGSNYAIALGSLVGLYFFISYAVTTFPHQEQSRLEYHRVYVADRFFVPRFWEQGLLMSQ